MLAHRFSLLTITGGCGPFTLAGELMGTENAAVSTIERPDFLQQVLEFCLEVNLRYLNALAAAGAECLLIAEPTGAILSPGMFRRFSGVYLKRLVEALPLPVILHICGDASHLIEEACATGALGISLDAPVSLAAAARRVGKSTLIIGNLDPVEVFLEMDEGDVRTRTRQVLEEMRGFPGYVAASGCDLSPMTPQGNIKAFVEAVREFR
jgi:uroporphyrinogen decarboxylase